ncbi:MAG: hypothetical protein V3571_01230 [Pseudodesulfovibrio sp.]
MSDFGISVMSMAAQGMENQISGFEASRETIRTDMSGSGPQHMASEQAIIGTEVVSRTDDYFGAGTDFSSTGTDVDIRTTANNILESGYGSITDTIV